MHQKLIVRNLGKSRYEKTLQAMQVFTQKRAEETTDEFWLVEHFPVFTQGQAGKPEHILHPGDIPIIQSDRGGQVTYHGPGQLLLYTLLDIKRKNITVRTLVRSLEQSIIDLLSDYNITANTQHNAPGVYVKEAKIASLGLRIRHGYSYHGLSLNIDMDLEPFRRIHPCGYSNLKVTQISHFLLQPKFSFAQISTHLIKHLARILEYTTIIEPFQQQFSKEKEIL